MTPTSGDDRRKVGIVTPYYPPSLGGVQSYAEQFARRLVSAPDLAPVVITTADPPGVHGSDLPTGPGRSVQDGVPVIRLAPLVRVSNTPFHPAWVLRARRLLAREQIALLHTHAPVPGLADVFTAAAGRRPVVSTYHAGSMVKGDSRWDGLLRGYERWVLPRVLGRADQPVAVSSTSLAAGLPGAATISPGVDLDRFTPPEDGVRRDPTLLYVGRLDRSSAWKGVDVLLRAFADVARQDPTARLRIVGDGDARPDLTALAAGLGISERVDFSGVLTGADLRRAYQRATALVLPSLSESESFGMTLVEAMACGCPVVGSDVGGITAVIDDDRTGRLVAPGDHRQLAGVLGSLLTDPDRVARYGKEGRRVAEQRYGWEQRWQQQVAIYRRLLSLPVPADPDVPPAQADVRTDAAV